MKRPLHAMVAVAALSGAVLVPLVTSAPDPPPVRILIVGDSVTQGSAGDWTWRYRLWRHLESAGMAVDFVGPRDDLWDRNLSTAGSHDYQDPAFDQDHASVWGMLLLHQPIPVETLMTDYAPDAVVELLGFNDIRFGATVPEVDTGLSEFVAGARSVDPSVAVVLGELSQTWVDGVSEFNAQLPELAAGLDSVDSRVVATADPGLTAFTDTYDPAHPAATGEVKIAAAVADALACVGIGAPMDRPLPQVPNGPRQPARLTVAPGDRRALLSWVLPPGADAVTVETCQLSEGGAWQRLPFSIPYPRASWTSEGLTNGVAYGYRVRAAKGTAVAEDIVSTGVRVAPGVPLRVQGLVVIGRDHAFVASWRPARLATSYRLRWWPTHHPGRDQVLSTTELRHRVCGLVAGRRYVVTVRGVRHGLKGPASDHVHVRPTGSPVQHRHRAV